MGQHYLDPIQYALGKDDTGPVEIEAYAPWPAHPDAVGMWGRITMRYEDDTTLILESGEWGGQEPGDPPYIEGPKGKYYRDGRTDPPGLLDPLDSMPDPPRLVSFNEALRTRGKPSQKPPAEAAHRSACLVHLANVAIRMGRPIRWDPVAERVVGDEEANRLVDVPMRAPWHL
jgi:hypothetical protein